jgi:hypothetical protein
LLRIILSPLLGLLRHTRTPDAEASLQREPRIFFLTLPWAIDDAPTETAPLYFVKRLHTATKYRGAAKTKARYRTADTETSILLARQPGAANEAPDNSRKIVVGKSEVAGIKL